jgi:hypothetical protein
MAKKLDFKKIGMKAVGVSAGAVAGTLANKAVPNMNAKIRGVIKIAAGAVLPELMPKATILSDVGAGIIATGAIDLYNGFTGTTVSGIGATDLAIAGDEDYEITGTSDNGEELSGIEGEEPEVSGLNEEDNAIGAVETSEAY